MIIRLLLGILVLAQNSPLLGEKIETILISQPKKVTVGPFDNYQGVLDEKSDRIIYTRNTNQVPQIHYQDLQSQEPMPLLDATADSKDPALFAGGDFVAFTYYKYDSKGDICLIAYNDEKVNCLTGKDTAEDSPFWLTEKKLGFMQKIGRSNQTQLVVMDIKSKGIEIIAKGDISSPAASSDARYLIFGNTNGKSRKQLFSLYDLSQKKIISSIQFDLPGFSGFARFASDDSYIYFSHYLNDTNFDQAIDGKDNSVIFRIPTAKVLQGGDQILPEQITSVENNCNFPYPSKDQLYITCAFEGSLDIYTVPLAGVVAANLSKDGLWEVHQSTRSYEDRILILNTLRYRFPDSSNNEVLERILSNHLNIGDMTATFYYIDKLRRSYENSGKTDLVNFYELLRKFLVVKDKKGQQPPGVLTASFRLLVAKSMNEIESVEGWNDFKKILSAYLSLFVDDRAKALRLIDTIDFKSKLHPLARYLAFDLYEQLLSEKSPKRLNDLYLVMIKDSTLPDESKIFYAYRFLVHLEKTLPLQRLDYLKKLLTELKEDRDLSDLFNLEVQFLKIAAAADKKEKNEFAKSAKKIINQNNKSVLLRRVMHIRGIQILSAADEFDQMERISASWLTYTGIRSAEYSYAAEQFTYISLDKAYGAYSKNDYNTAFNIFYSVIRQTNDLEAHQGLIKTSLNRAFNRRDRMDLTYKQLKKERLAGDSQRYVDTLIKLIDFKPKSARETEYLEEAIAELESMTQAGTNPAMRYLLLGYCYHEILSKKADRFTYDQSLFKKAHHNYMLALDLGKDNTRLKASTLTNLGWLHWEVRNYALAAEYFATRSKYPFINSKEKSQFLFNYARSLFFNNNLTLASQIASKGMEATKSSNPKLFNAFKERFAFYSLYAGNLPAAEKTYAELIKDNALATPLNITKATLALGFAQYSQKNPQAKETLLRAIKQAEALRTMPAGSSRLLPIMPETFPMIAYGLLSKMAENPIDAAKMRMQRVKVSESLKNKLAEANLDETTWLAALIMDLTQVVDLYDKGKQPQNAANYQRRALQEANKWANASSSPRGTVVYQTMINYMAYALKNPTFYNKDDHKLIAELSEKAAKNFAEIQAFKIQPLESYQRAKLEMFKAAYDAKVAKLNDLPALSGSLQKILAADAVSILKEKLPEKYTELSQYTQTLL